MSWAQGGERASERLDRVWGSRESCRSGRSPVREIPEVAQPFGSFSQKTMLRLPNHSVVSRPMEFSPLATGFGQGCRPKRSGEAAAVFLGSLDTPTRSRLRFPPVGLRREREHAAPATQVCVVRQLAPSARDRVNRTVDTCGHSARLLAVHQSWPHSANARTLAGYLFFFGRMLSGVDRSADVRARAPVAGSQAAAARPRPAAWSLVTWSILEEPPCSSPQVFSAGSRGGRVAVRGACAIVVAMGPRRRGCGMPLPIRGKLTIARAAATRTRTPARIVARRRAHLAALDQR